LAHAFSRKTLRDTIEDAMKAGEIVETLVADGVPLRKAFIQAHARQAKDLDV
jgi:DNA gyrase/topoisomerase IV subunit B